MREFELPPLHQTQRLVAASQARYRVASCGRRWGKTHLAASLAAQAAADGGKAFWLAPIYRQGVEGFQLLRALAVQIRGTRIQESTMTVTFPGGGLVEVRSADDATRLRGTGLDFVVLDECRDMDSKTWFEVIRPALMDRSGKAFFGSTPGGRDWFHELFQKGQRGEPGWESWHFPTSSNPYICAAELEEAKRGMPERLWRQEILAEFLADGTGVFRGVRAASTAEPEPGEHDASHISFFDPARSVDFNAVATFRAGARLRQVHCDRWNGTGWDITKARLSRLQDYRGALFVDCTTAEYSEPLVREIQQLLGPRVQVQAFRFSNANKSQMTDTFALLLEQRQIDLLDPVKCEGSIREAVENQIGELEAWSATKLPSGLTRYAAPGNEHDDGAVACLAAAMLCKEEAPPTPDDWSRLRRKFRGTLV